MFKMILSKLFKKEEKKQEIKLNLDELKNKVNDMKRKEDEIIFSKGEIIVNNIKINIKKVKESLKILGEKEISSEDKRVYDIVKISRKNLITQISNALGIIVLPDKINYDTMLELNGPLTIFFAKISNSSKSFYYTSLMLRDEIKEIEEDLKEIENENKNLSEILGQKYEILNEICKKIKKIKEYESEKENFKKEIEITEKRVKEQKERAEILNETLHNLENSEEYKTFLENKKKIIILKDNIKDNETKIRTQISPLVRPLKKFERIAKNKKDIFMFINEPIEFLNNSYLKANDILLKLEKMIKEDKINLDEKERKKKLEKIKEIEEGFLLKLLQERKLLCLELNKCNKLDFPVLRKISETEIEIKEIKFDLKPKEDINERVEEEIFATKRRIEELCSKLGENIVLKD